jgi:hypothetical protein
MRGALDAAKLPVAIHREKTKTLYAVEIPWKSVGLSGPPMSAFGLNFLLNDNDGSKRKTWLQSPSMLLSAGKLAAGPSKIVPLTRDIYL